MQSVHDALDRVEGQHRTGLQWFAEHARSVVTWAAMQEFSTEQVRIVNQAKGIYKPSWSRYTLSVRQTLNGPYSDQPITERDDGSWQFLYFQENQDPAQRDKEATNRGLMRCMEDGIPIGVLLQRSPKPGATYEVKGLALVAEWRDGYFILEGFGATGEARSRDDVDTSDIRKAYERLIQTETDFDPRDIADERERLIAEVVRRRGQAKFRAALLNAYEERCCITGCSAVAALEAAHISPYRGDKSNSPANGLLLRADLHNLFDLGLIVVDVRTFGVVVAPELHQSEYGYLAGKKLSLPTDDAVAPSKEALVAHRAWAGI